MNVLNIVTASDTTFFQDQVRVLDEYGVKADTVDALTIAERVGNSDGLGAAIHGSLFGHSAPYYAICSANLMPRVLRSSITNDYDLVHVNSGMVAPFAYLQHQRPIVMTLWGDDLLGDRLYGIQSEVAKRCAERAAAAIVRSREMAAALDCDAHIIPSGVDLEKFQPIDRDRACQLVGWDRTGKHVLFPYDPVKRKKRYPVARAVVEEIDGEMDEDVELQVLYGVPHDEMYRYYSAADALLLPSLREGSPNTVKEAMACNLPVVSTDVGDVARRLADVTHSHVCSDDTELKHSLRTVLAAGERSNGRRFVEPVSLERMGARLLEIYREVLDEYEHT